MGDKATFYLSKAKQYPLVTGALLLAVVFAVVLFMRGSRLEAVEQSLEDAEAEWTRIEFNLMRAHHLEQHVEEIQGIADEISTRLLNPSEVAINYDYFYRLERETGVRLTQLNQGAVLDSGGKSVPGLPALKSYSAVAYSIGVEGTVPDILTFLSRVSHGRFLTRISAFNFSSSAQGGQTVTANIQCQILAQPQ